MQLIIDGNALRPLIAEVVKETLRQIAEAPGGPERVAYSEPEMAAMLGWHRHVLRDERLKGRIGFSRGPAGRVLYRREDVLRYLAERAVAPKGQDEPQSAEGGGA